MKLFLRSIVTAIAITAAVMSCMILLIAPQLHCVIGRPVIDESRTFTYGPSRQVRLDNSDGDVQIRTASPDAVVILARVRIFASGRGSENTAKEYAKTLMKASEADDGLSVITEPEDRPDALTLTVDYSVTVPEGTDLAIDNGNGNVSVAKGCGAVMVHGRNADIRIVQPSGAVTATTTNGQINIEAATSDTAAETVNGSVFVDTGTGILKAKTTNGAIVARVQSRNVTECNLTSQNGGITLVASDNVFGRLNARTARGRIRFDLPVNTDIVKGCKNSRHVRGTIGGAGGIGDGNTQTQFTISAGNGNIWIARND